METTITLLDRSYNPNAVAEKGQLFGLPFSYDNATHIVMPIPWDATASFGTGSAANAKAILMASAQIDLGHPFLSEYWRAGVHMASPDPEIARLNEKAGPLAAEVFRCLESGSPAPRDALQELNRLSQTVQDRIYTQCRAVLSAGKTLCTLGGEHSISAAAFAAAADHHSSADHAVDIGLLVIDAHHDFRHNYAGMTHSHASVMRRILDTHANVSACSQVGIRDYCQEELDYAKSQPGRVFTHTDYDIYRVLDSGQSWASYCDAILAQLPDNIYLSVDIDGLMPDLCPNTGTPVPGGLTFNQVLTLCHRIHKSKKTIIGMDLVEVACASNEGDCINANVAARVLYTMLGLQSELG